MRNPDGRAFQHELKARLGTLPDGRLSIEAPAVGYWRGRPAAGSLVAPGTAIGELEILGVLVRLRAPSGARGIVVGGPDSDRARIAVGYGDTLLILDADTASMPAEQREASAATQGGPLVLLSPSSGRFYARAAPNKPVFVSPGDTVTEGQTVALLEVMKTFHRITYGGDTLPESAEVVRVVPEDGDDLEPGDVILELR